MSYLLNPGIFQLSIISGFFAWGTIFYMVATNAPTDPSYRWIKLLAVIHVFRYLGLIALVPAHFYAAARVSEVYVRLRGKISNTAKSRYVKTIQTDLQDPKFLEHCHLEF